MNPLTNAELVGFLRNALHYLYDSVHLRRNPLVQTLGLSDEFDPAAALQRLLTEAIRDLKPAVDEPPQSRAWHVYDILNLHYVRQFDRRMVANQLGISERQLRREQRLALEDLAQKVWHDLGRSPLLIQTPPNAAPAQPEHEQDKAFSEELGWLKSPMLEQRIPLGEILRTVHGLVQSLAKNMQVNLQIEIDTRLEDIPVNQLVIRNTLLSIISAVIPQTTHGKVTLMAARSGLEIEIKVIARSSSTSQVPILDMDHTGLEAARRLVSFYGASLATFQQASGFTISLLVPLPEQIPILVVDDNADWLDMLKRYAVGSRYQVIGTRDPETARNLALKVQPAVIFLDVMMPNIDGWQIFSELRNEPSTSQTPIVICTVLPLEGLALSLGVNAFLQKPVTQDQFLKTLEQQINPPHWP